MKRFAVCLFLIPLLMLVSCVVEEHATVKFCTFRSWTMTVDSTEVLDYDAHFVVYLPEGFNITHSMIKKRFSKTPLDKIVYKGVTYYGIEGEYYVVEESNIGSSVVDFLNGDPTSSSAQIYGRDPSKVLVIDSNDELVDIDFDSGKTYCVISKFTPNP